MDEYAYPVGFGVSLCPAEAEPGFETPAQQRLVWGGEWGACDEVGPLRKVLVRLPATSFGGCVPTAGTSARRRWWIPTAAGTGRLVSARTST